MWPLASSRISSTFLLVREPQAQLPEVKRDIRHRVGGLDEHAVQRRARDTE